MKGRPLRAWFGVISPPLPSDLMSCKPHCRTCEWPDMGGGGSIPQAELGIPAQTYSHSIDIN